jgi:hypothetical protein
VRREEQRPKLTIEGDFEAIPCALDRPEFTGLKMDLARRMKASEKEDTRLRRAMSDPMLFRRRLPRKPSEPRTPTVLYRPYTEYNAGVRAVGLLLALATSIDAAKDAASCR